MIPAADGLPEVGGSARRLGVRVPQDIGPDPSGHVLPGRGGMSVAPGSPWNLPHHRRPKMLGRGSTGPDRDRVYDVAESHVSARELAVRPDPTVPDIHAFVEPAVPMTLARYEEALAGTRPDWRQAWP